MKTVKPSSLFPPGSRIRVNEKSPWPERVGCEGVVVDPAIFDGKYPGEERQRSGRERIILLDEDPLVSGQSINYRDWTCCIGIESLTLLGNPVEATDE